MKKSIRKLIVATVLLAGANAAMAQEEADLYEMSLDELMNVSVVSASKEEERLFDAPVATYSVSREEISKAGALSIPEALRLIPGVIVRETTNGNYDIHLRGFDNVAEYTYANGQINSLTLVMINDRPVFNYNQGGTFWETLPVGIADVERIEVVEGPSAPLFGPNAVTGVINIITRDFDQKKLMASGQVITTAPGNGLMGSLALGSKLSEKVSIGITGNYQDRNRTDDEQYLYGYGYMKSRDYRREDIARFGVDPEHALTSKGVNGYASFKPSEDIQLNLSTGWQSSEAQRFHYMSTTPLVYNEMSSFYTNLSSRIKSLSLRLSYTNGQDELHKTSSTNSTSYDYSVAEAVMDYDLKLGSKFKLRPSLSYQTTTYSDLDYLEGFPLGGLLNAEASLNTLAGSIRAEYNPVEELRLIGSARGDKFNVRDELFISYQFAATYSPNENWVLRASHGKSHSGMFYNTAFIDATGAYSEQMFFHAVENRDVDLTNNTLSEIGVRSQLKGNLQLDLSIFYQKLANPMNLVATGNVQVLPTGQVIVDFSSEGLPITAHQKGLTASVKWLPNQQWQVKPFITLQNTMLKNFDFYSTPTFSAPAEKEHDSTPSVFGGWFVSYQPVSRLTLSTTSYFYGQHTIYHQLDVSFPGEEGEISSKFLLNARASYRLFNELSVFAGGKNLLNQDSREYYGTDRIGSTYFTGLSYNF